MQISRSDETHCKPKLITLQISENLPLPSGERLIESEGYVLTISPENECISITGPTAAGVFNGVVSLISLAEANPGSELPGGYSFTGVVIVDAPRFAFRGMMMDVARYFHTKEEILKLLDVMATYKLNKLHLHLGDDEGWRLEIPGFEELTDVRIPFCTKFVLVVCG